MSRDRPGVRHVREADYRYGGIRAARCRECAARRRRRLPYARRQRPPLPFSTALLIALASPRPD